jgi:predicted nucleic acid-binding protein
MARPLPKEITSLIHHITLNEQGWWDKTIQRLIISALGSVENKQLTTDEILTFVKSNYDTHVDNDKINKQLEKLCSTKAILRIEKGVFVLSESELNNFKSDIAKFEESEENVKNQFIELIKKECNADEQEKITWEVFNTELLIPILYEFGAKTYELITGKGIKLDSNHRFKKFLSKFPIERHVIIKNAVIDFLNPQNPTVRGLILRKLNAYFFLEAIKLPSNAIDKINEASKKQITFKVFVDTNFLFSFLGLHENPSNEAAKSLLEIISKVSNKVKIKLYITPLTIDETKKVITNEERRLKNIRPTQILSNVALHHISNGFAKKYFVECSKHKKSIKAEDYFEPYLNHLVKVLRDKGVEIYNDNKFETYTTDQRVIDDILDQQKVEETVFKNKPHLQKSYEKLEHDFVLWHFVNDLRPSYVESADEAGAFVTTVDFRFINYDIAKRKNKRMRVPVCVHPTNLIQILQLWVPRDESYDIAILSNLRFPFLFTEFDADTELTTIRIIEQLSRYESIDDLKEETVTSILFNQALRQKIQTTEDKTKDQVLVKDAIIEEIKIHKILVDDKVKQVEILDDKVKKKEIIVAELSEGKNKAEQTNNELIGRIEKLENEKRLENKYHTDKEQWQNKRELHLLKKWDELPKRKWYLPIFIIGVLSVLGIILFLYRQFYLEAYFSILVSMTIFLGGTIILSFFNRDKISISFLYNFRTEKYRKDKMKEFEKDFLKDNPEPLKKDYTDIK